jgi:ATP adenylyltransferase
MDRIWTPWRYNYVSKAEPSSGCIFCEKAQPGNDEENLVLYRGELNYILLNLYPYNNGHVMIAPYEHVATLEGVSVATAEEMMRLVRRTEQVIREVYRPQGVNLGMNIGECAGAGVAGHIHMHVLPRWFGDGGFMASIGETRIIPEDLTTTWKKLLEVFGG